MEAWRSGGTKSSKTLTLFSFPAGMVVVIGDIDNDSLQPAVKKVSEAAPGSKCIALQVDVTKKESVEAFKKKALR